MKSISSLSVLVSIIMNNIINVNGTECLPNGCFYDLSVDLSKKIECKPDGSLEILSYHGNNGCDNEDFYLSHLTFNSQVENECCKPADESLLCRNNEACSANQYCKDGLCVVNPCNQTNDGGYLCTDNDDCPVSSQALNCGCQPDSDGDLGRCVPGYGSLDEELEVTSYSVTVINEGSSTANIGIFEVNPSSGLPAGGYPVVFGEEAAGSGTTVTFSWQLNWGLSWSDGQAGQCQPLTGGIIYSRKGQIIPVSTTNTQNNGASVYYASGAYEIERAGYPDLPTGQLQIRTDNSFSKALAAADCFTLAVTQEGNTIFTMNGEPNTAYTFTIEPKYYLSTIQNKKGETVSATAISTSYPITFDGRSDIILCLNDLNEFYEC